MIDKNISCEMYDSLFRIGKNISSETYDSFDVNCIMLSSFSMQMFPVLYFRKHAIRVMRTVEKNFTKCIQKTSPTIV